MLNDVDIQVRFTVDDEALTGLHRLALGSSTTAVQPWAHRLERHSLTWIGAFVERTGADELMITSQIHDHAVRLKSYALLAEAVATA